MAYSPYETDDMDSLLGGPLGRSRDLTDAQRNAIVSALLAQEAAARRGSSYPSYPTYGGGYSGPAGDLGGYGAADSGAPSGAADSE